MTTEFETDTTSLHCWRWTAWKWKVQHSLLASLLQTKADAQCDQLSVVDITCDSQQVLTKSRKISKLQSEMCFCMEVPYFWKYLNFLKT